LMPIALASGPAGLSIVREKEQRTLEPILATPIGDRELVLAKLAGALGPALLWTWTAGAASYGVSAAAAAVLVGPLVLPTLGNLVGLLLLGPVLAAVAALGGIGVSARFTDSQSANLFTGLVVVPLTLILLGLVGRPAMANPAVGLIASGLGLGLCALLFQRAVRRLRREELLTRWR
ncbi:MAG: ABC transporter permease, partial [Gemmatimonadales bacterium]